MKNRFIIIANILLNYQNLISIFSTSSVALTLMKWQHMVFTMKGNTYTIYLDGVSTCTRTANPPLANIRTSCWIGIN